MTKSIKTELWKALHNPMFYLSTAIGIAIAVSNVIRSASRIQYFNEAMASLSRIVHHHGVQSVIHYLFNGSPLQELLYVTKFTFSFGPFWQRCPSAGHIIRSDKMVYTTK